MMATTVFCMVGDTWLYRSTVQVEGDAYLRMAEHFTDDLRMGILV
jgi:hypothetical protein